MGLKTKQKRIIRFFSSSKLYFSFCKVVTNFKFPDISKLFDLRYYLEMWGFWVCFVAPGETASVNQNLPCHSSPSSPNPWLRGLRLHPAWGYRGQGGVGREGGVGRIGVRIVSVVSVNLIIVSRVLTVSIFWGRISCNIIYVIFF